jgi:hypothetical protein
VAGTALMLCVAITEGIEQTAGSAAESSLMVKLIGQCIVLIASIVAVLYWAEAYIIKQDNY